MTHVRSVAIVLGGVLVAGLSLGGALPAAASSGVRLPPPGGSPATPVVPAVRTVVVGGMPGWQIALIAIAAALIAALAAALVTALVAMPGERARRPASAVAAYVCPVSGGPGRASRDSLCWLGGSHWQAWLAGYECVRSAMTRAIA